MLSILVETSSAGKDERRIKSTATTPKGATPEMSSLCLHSNGSSLSNEDAKSIHCNKAGVTTQRESSHVNDMEKSRYVVIKSKGEKTDTCGGTSTSEETAMYMTLEHAIACIESECERENCHTLKQFIEHYRSCSKKGSGGCMICFAFDAMACQVSSEESIT